MIAYNFHFHILKVNAMTLTEWQRNKMQFAGQGVLGSSLTAVEVDEEHPLEVFVVHQCRVHSWTWLVVNGEITHVRVPPEQVELLLIDYEFLQNKQTNKQQMC